MTDKERALEIADLWGWQEVVEAAQRHLREVVAEEREACARIVEETMLLEDFESAAVAKKIRARV